MRAGETSASGAQSYHKRGSRIIIRLSPVRADMESIRYFELDLARYALPFSPDVYAVVMFSIIYIYVCIFKLVVRLLSAI